MAQGDTQRPTPEERFAMLELVLPNPTRLPPNLELPFRFVNVRGSRVLISGHAKNAPDGTVEGPFGQVGSDFNTEEAYDIAKGIGLSILGNLKAEIGDLSRVAGWLRIFGMVNSAPGYAEQHVAVNGCSDLIIDVFGPDIGAHARSAIGTNGLPMNFAMEIEAELILHD